MIVARIITGIIILILLFLLFFYMPYISLNLFFILLLLYILRFEWPQFKQPQLTIFYPVVPFCALILLNTYHRDYLLLLFTSLFIHDSCAYAIGKLWGRHKIAPHISPGKTWEGFLGATGISCGVTKFLFSDYSIFLILALNICALAGDLFESWLKRKVHLKDSGTLLPGHGGILDRFDSIMFGAFFLIIITFFQYYGSIIKL
ncbi:MAG: phosphatidate cytidylyltransferase [Candidatus Babeliaceae bacterium]|jgi:phosphatidate cytidylyltransferase